MAAGVKLPWPSTEVLSIRKGESYESYVHCRNSHCFSDYWHGAQ